MAKQGSVKRDSETGRFLIGRRAFAKISAVEGIRMPREMQADFATFDNEKASPSQRRSALASKYGAKKK
ncbi:MAG TPA: hypothetical protein VFV70_00735 [Hyphomonadaceae bacterium]|nr:hypothetical protein [Hyphomonadaceae bacterium]